MKAPRKDFTIRPNDQPQRREQINLWDVVIGKVELITTCRSELDAQQLADKLNIDPWYLSRGDKLADRQRRAFAP
jgi:glycosyltransferase A (GT-A) superfamily protein (DUF2064 family)